MTERDLDVLLRDIPKQCAVAALAGYCQGICRSGNLPAAVRAELQRLSDNAYAAVCEKVPA